MNQSCPNEFVGLRNCIKDLVSIINGSKTGIDSDNFVQGDIRRENRTANQETGMKRFYGYEALTALLKMQESVVH
ncbi:hypothetical protein Sjap_008238 [Stephania japonica]|uniref:Uncharacterized protein n=1 Tax=Stephania japonica TaxID=461633 RepID=A0AAP0JPS3_9MAGN